MSNTPVDQDSPELGQSSDTYDETAVYLAGEMRNNANYTLGSILTVLEASMTDKNQLEAVKSLVRKEMFLMTDRNQGVMYERAKMQRSGLTPKKYVEFRDSSGEFEAHSIQQ
jgi:hypothetical protein